MCVVGEWKYTFLHRCNMLHKEFVPQTAVNILNKKYHKLPLLTLIINLKTFIIPSTPSLVEANTSTLITSVKAKKFSNRELSTNT